MAGVLLFVLLGVTPASAQEVPDSLALEKMTSLTPLTLEDALKVALSESEIVKIADKEIERTGYAKKGTYAALFPQIDMAGSYQRTLIKNDIRAMMGSDSPMASMMSDTKIGSLNTFAVNATAVMPLINTALWKSIKISAQGVELAV